LCVTHTALPQFVFELNDDTVRLRLLASSDRDGSTVALTDRNGSAITYPKVPRSDKPEVLEDRRLDAAVGWLRRLDWFTPEPGIWSGDANESFLITLARAWPEKPQEATTWAIPPSKDFSFNLAS
jgi:hypothetical protein